MTVRPKHSHRAQPATGTRTTERRVGADVFNIQETDQLLDADTVTGVTSSGCRLCLN